MNIPGTNLLNLALSVMNPAVMQYSMYNGRTVDGAGQYVDTYAAAVTVRGSFQAISRNLVERMGLDFQSNYAHIFVPQAVLDVARDSAGDQFSYLGQTWQVLSTTPWNGVDGWTEAVCVLVPTATDTANVYILETGFPYMTEDGSQFYIMES